MLRTLNSRLDTLRDLGLLIIRVGVGLSFMFHGWPKLAGGPERWAAVAEFAGITFLPTFFGFIGGLAEFAGGLLLALGLLYRPACLFLFGTMAFAFSAHLRAGDGFGDFSHSLELGFVFAGLFFIGAGRFSVDEYVFNKQHFGY